MILQPGYAVAPRQFEDPAEAPVVKRRLGCTYELMSLVCSRAHASGMNTAM